MMILNTKCHVLEDCAHFEVLMFAPDMFMVIVQKRLLYLPIQGAHVQYSLVYFRALPWSHVVNL